MFFNQPLLVTVIIFGAIISVICILVFEIWCDVKQRRIKRWLENIISNKCPNCQTCLEIKGASKDENNNIEYFSYCKKCHTFFRDKIEEVTIKNE